MKVSRDVENECPSNDFENGNPCGKCWGDGHYMCVECVHYRADFLKLGQDYIDFVHTFQTGITFSILPI